MKGIMFDSNAIDKIADGTLPIELIRESTTHGYVYYITHLQSDEISRCKDVSKRQILILFLIESKLEIVPTTVTVWGVSRFGKSKMGKGELYSQLLNESNNNVNDAIIAETSILEGYQLITEDKQLKKKVCSYGGRVCNVGEFKNELETLIHSA